MIIGITASENLITAPPPGTTALGTFDFVNGVYDWNGTTLTAAQVVDQTGWIGAGGLEVPASQGAGAELLYADAQTFIGACQVTMAFEFEATSAGEQVIFYCASASLLNYVYFEYWGGTSLLDSDNNTFRNVTDGGSVGTLRLSGTRINAADLSMSTAGGVPDTSFGYTQFDLPTVGNPFTKFYLGGFSTATVEAINIHWMKVYNPVSDAVLPTLSA